MENLAEFDRSLMEFFNYNSEAMQLFLSLAFLMQRNMMGGLTTYELMAVSNIKKKLAKCLDSYDDKDVINSLIEMISSADYKDMNLMFDSNSVKYIALQDNRALCKILATYLPDDIGMLVKIPISDDLDYNELIEQAKARHPKIIFGLDAKPVNPWAVIFSPPSTEEVNNHIVLSFPTSPQEQRSFYYFKTLGMAKAILYKPKKKQEVEVEVEKPSAIINSIRFLKGIFALTGKEHNGVNRKLTSRPFITRDIAQEEESDAIDGEVYETEESTELEVDTGEAGTGLTVLENETTINGGFFDVNHGLHFSIRKPVR